MIELPAVRVCGGGGGRRRVLRRRMGLTQRYELQGRIHGPAHQRSKRALVLSAVGHRREHVFVRLRSWSDGKLRKDRDPPTRESGFRGLAPNPPRAPCNRSCTALRIGFADGPPADRGAPGSRRSGLRDALRHPLGDRRDPRPGRLRPALRRPRDVRRRPRGRERDHLRPARARHPPRRVDLAEPDRHDLGLRRRRDQARARLARRRRDLGGARPAHERERRALGRVSALHGARGDHRRDRDLPRLRDPGRRRDGRRA